MKILILNGNPDVKNNKFDEYINSLSGLMISGGHEVKIKLLREMKILFCTGCWGCWVKNPGKCSFDDDSAIIRKEYIHSELVIFSSPVIMGFTSTVLKKANDKLLPLLLPYIEIVNGELHHKSRYKKYPKTALILEKGKDTDEKDIKIISDIYRRNAINLKTSFSFLNFIHESPELITDEINNL